MGNLGPMSEDDQGPEDTDRGEFELPLPDEEAEAGGRPLRRRLFGYRAGDVEEAISSRDETLAILRRDVAALWLAFGQHERAIRQMLAAIEALGGTSVDPPGGRADSEGPAPETADSDSPAPGPGPGPAAASASAASTASGSERIPGAPEAIGAQLAGLDDVLAAIEHATQSLEQAYAEEISGAAEAGDASPAEGAKQPDDAEAETDRES